MKSLLEASAIYLIVIVSFSSTKNGAPSGDVSMVFLMLCISISVHHSFLLSLDSLSPLFFSLSLSLCLHLLFSFCYLFCFFVPFLLILASFLSCPRPPLLSSLPQPVISWPWAWRPSSGPLTAPRSVPSSPSAMRWRCPTSRRAGSTRPWITRTASTSTSTPTTPPSAGRCWTSCSSTSGSRSPWSTRMQLVGGM